MTSALHGMNVDPLNPTGCPDPAKLKTLGFDAARFVLRPEPAVISYYMRCMDVGVVSFNVLARESFSPFGNEYDPATWKNATAYYVSNFPHMKFCVVGNEEDGIGPSSWGLLQSDYYKLWTTCRNYLKDVGGVPNVLIGGLVSGQPDWIASLKTVCATADGICVHPYSKDPAEALALIREYEQKTGISDIYLTEWNRPADQIPSYVQMMNQNVTGGMWFCWSDGMVDGFGLVDRMGNQKPEYLALVQAVGGETVVDEPAEEPAQEPAPTFSVGNDIVAKMQELGDEPASDELYFKNDRGQDMWSEAKGVSGNSYYYTFHTKKVSVITSV